MVGFGLLEHARCDFVGIRSRHPPERKPSTTWLNKQVRPEIPCSVHFSSRLTHGRAVILSFSASSTVCEAPDASQNTLLGKAWKLRKSQNHQTPRILNRKPDSKLDSKPDTTSLQGPRPSSSCQLPNDNDPSGALYGLYGAFIPKLRRCCLGCSLLPCLTRRSQGLRDLQRMFENRLV